VIKQQNSLRAELFKPAYWGTWLLLGLLWAIMWLPRKWVMRLGAWLGDQTRLRNSKRRHIAKTNIDLCFPELSESGRADMLIEHFRSYGRGLVDLGLIMMSKKERIEKFSEVLGAEYLTPDDPEQRVILVSYHTTTLDMCSSSMLADIKLVSMMKREKNPVLNWFLHRSRTRYKNARIFMRDQSLRGILEGMKQGKLCYLIPDEDFGAGSNTVFAPFFGQYRATLNIVSRLARVTNAIVLPAICRLDSDTGRYITTVLPALENFPGESHEADAAAINQAMENLIRQAPEQYLWTFRWFRTLQNGSDPYDSKIDADRSRPEVRG
jgi:KDO2-lipid IV(A) lauroyltransferase